MRQIDIPVLIGPDGDTLLDRFESFHHRNPGVYHAIVSIALDLKSRGFRKLGMKLIFERMRWLYAIQTSDDYFLNNNYTAFYARLVMHREAELVGFFQLRRQTDEYNPAETVD